MRAVLLVALVLLAPSCGYPLTSSRAHAPSPPPPEPAPVCRDVPRYEPRVVPREGEWTQPSAEGWPMLRVCRAASASSPAECHTETEGEYERARTEQVQVGVTRVCEPALEAGAAATSPAYAPPSPGGPIYVRGYHRRDGTHVRPHTRRRPR